MSFSSTVCNAIKVPVGVKLKYCNGFPCGLDFNFQDKTLCSPSLEAFLDRVKSICKCGGDMVEVLKAAPGLLRCASRKAARGVDALAARARWGEA